MSASWRPSIPGRVVEWHRTIDTTMRAAAELAFLGAAAGTIVGADEQTAGQGRMGRTWYSPPESGLYFTVILRPELDVRQLPLVTLALGCAVHDAILLLAGLYADLRWPNDVLLSEKKVCGVLTRYEHEAVLAGIGLNLNHESFPPELAGQATSLKLETGRTFAREEWLRFLARSIDTQVNILTRAGADSVLSAFTVRSTYTERRRVIVDEQTRGTTAGLSPDGFLRLRTDSGDLVTIHAGGVRPLD